MGTWVPRLIDSPEAAVLADLAGTKYDLETAQGFCDQLAAIDLTSPGAQIVADALSTAIVVRYSRCFTIGVRKKLKDDVLIELPEYLREVHKFLRLVRDKYIAHSVNGLEENEVTVHVRAPPDPPAVGGIGIREARTIILGAEEVVQVRELCRAVASSVDRMIAEQQTVVKQQIERLPVEEIYRLPEPAAYVPDWEKMGRSRRRK